jgi:SPX domain protein involved in polyphosphate accumulation
MVNYGESLRKAKRPGWEDSYLDYDGLKRIRNRLEALLVERDDDIAASLVSVESDSPYLQKYFELRTEFADKLHSEIEKISLFSLARLGELANAVGVLRFMKPDPDNSRASVFSDEDRRVETYHESGDEETPLNTSRHNYDEFGEKCKRQRTCFA